MLRKTRQQRYTQIKYQESNKTDVFFSIITRQKTSHVFTELEGVTAYRERFLKKLFWL